MQKIVGPNPHGGLTSIGSFHNINLLCFFFKFITDVYLGIDDIDIDVSILLTITNKIFYNQSGCVVSSLDQNILCGKSLEEKYRPICVQDKILNSSPPQ